MMPVFFLFRIVLFCDTTYYLYWECALNTLWECILHYLTRRCNFIMKFMKKNNTRIKLLIPVPRVRSLWDIFYNFQTVGVLKSYFEICYFFHRTILTTRTWKWKTPCTGVFNTYIARFEREDHLISHVNN